MRNAGLEEAQAGIKISGRNINNLRYADDITIMAESEEKLKSLLRKVKEESENSWLKTKFSHSVMSDSLRSHGPQHARPPCPSPTPRVYSNSYPLSLSIQPSHLLLSPSHPALNLSQH